jgi:hypothetical protein
MKNTIFSFLLGLLVFTNALGADLPVKKSNSGICHAPGSSYYNQTKHYTSYKTLDDCLRSGGRLPKR